MIVTRKFSRDIVALSGTREVCLPSNEGMKVIKIYVRLREAIVNDFDDRIVFVNVLRRRFCRIRKDYCEVSRPRGFTFD